MGAESPAITLMFFIVAVKDGPVFLMICLDPRVQIVHVGGVYLAVAVGVDVFGTWEVAERGDVAIAGVKACVAEAHRREVIAGRPARPPGERNSA